MANTDQLNIIKPQQDDLPTEQIITLESLNHISANYETQICRICLDSKQGFIVPCLCKGSARSVHYSCMKKWLENVQRKRLHKSSHTVKSLDCEVCKSKINYMSAEIWYLSFDQLKKNVNSQKGFLLLHLLVMATFAAAFVILLIGLTGTSLVKSDPFAIDSKAVMVLGAFECFIGICLIVLIYHFVIENLISVKTVITKIYNIQDRR